MAGEEAVEGRAEEEWRDGVRAGKKLGTYLRLKEKWGFEEYFESVLGKGDVLLARFRSGWRRDGEVVWRVHRSVDGRREGEKEREEMRHLQ